MTENDKPVGERAVELLVEHGYGPADELAGCTEAEIRDLEEQFDVELPEAYESCMRHIGKDTNGFLRGSEFKYQHVGRQQEFAEKRIEDNDVDFAFDESDVVFMGHQGYSFFFFNANEGPDPPVYLFMSPDPPRKVADSFSEWLFDRIK